MFIRKTMKVNFWRQIKNLKANKIFLATLHEMMLSPTNPLSGSTTVEQSTFYKTRSLLSLFAKKKSDETA